MNPPLNIEDRQSNAYICCVCHSLARNLGEHCDDCRGLCMQVFPDIEDLAIPDSTGGD